MICVSLVSMMWLRLDNPIVARYGSLVETLFAQPVETDRLETEFFYTLLWPPFRFIRLYITLVMGRPPPGIEIEACNEKITSYQLIKIRAMNGMRGKIIWVS